jgi:hypothetical protein
MLHVYYTGVRTRKIQFLFLQFLFAIRKILGQIAMPSSGQRLTYLARLCKICEKQRLKNCGWDMKVEISILVSDLSNTFGTSFSIAKQFADTGSTSCPRT